MRLLRNTALTLGGNVLGAPAGLLTSVVLARALSDVDFGVLLVTLPTVALTFTLSQLGVGSAVIYRIRRAKQPPGVVITSALLVTLATWGVVTGLVYAFEDSLLSWLSGQSGVVVPSVVLALALAQLGVKLIRRVMGSLARGMDRFAVWSQVNVLVKVGLFLALAVVLVGLDGGLIGALWVYVLVEAVAVAWLSVSLLRESGLGAPSVEEVREQLVFGLKSHAQATAGHVHEKVDVLMLQTLLANPVQAGIYELAARLVDQVRIIPESIAQALYPQLAGLSPEEAAKSAARTNRHAMVWMVLTSVCMAATGPFVLPLLYGQSKAAVIEPFLVLVPAMAMFSVYRVLAKYFTAMNRQAINIVVQVGTVALNLGLNYALIPEWGIVGAAAASLLSYGAAALAILVFFVTTTGRGVRESLVLTRADLSAYTGLLQRVRNKLRPRRT